MHPCKYSVVYYTASHIRSLATQYGRQINNIYSIMMSYLKIASGMLAEYLITLLYQFLVIFWDLWEKTFKVMEKCIQVSAVVRHIMNNTDDRFCFYRWNCWWTEGKKQQIIKAMYSMKCKWKPTDWNTDTKAVTNCEKCNVQLSICASVTVLHFFARLLYKSTFVQNRIHISKQKVCWLIKRIL